MSVRLSVYVHGDRVPTCAEWQESIRDAGHDLVFEDFSPRDQIGFVPMRLNGVECGFQYSLNKIESEEPEEILSIAGNRDYVAEFVWHSSEADSRAAEICAAMLAALTGGILMDPQSGAWAEGKNVFSLLDSQRAGERERRLPEAEKKWGKVTNRRCPECGSPCPEYRKTCWVCRYEIGRFTVY